MKISKYLIFLMANIALFSCLLYFYGNLIYSAYSYLRRPLYLTLTLVLGGPLVFGTTMVLIGVLYKKMKFFKMNAYGQRGLNVLMLSLAMIGFYFLVINWLLLAFDSLRVGSMFLAQLLMCYFTFASIIYVNTEKN